MRLPVIAAMLAVAGFFSACSTTVTAPPQKDGTASLAPLAAGPTECNPPSPQSGMPQISASDPHRFAINGQTWFPAGYYGSAFSVIDGALGGGYGAFQAFNHEWLDDLAANRLNYARLWAGYDSLATSPPVMHPYAMASDSQVDLDQWNDDYFSLLADTVQYARDKGIALQLILMHCGVVDYDGGTHRPDNYFYATRNVNGVSFTTSTEWYATSGPIWERHKAFVDKVLDTVGDQPNLTYEICNEKFVADGPADATFDQTRNDPFIRAMYDVIRARGDRHVVVGVDVPEHRSLPGFFIPSYSGDPNVLNTGGDIAGMHADLQGWFGDDVPVITDNDCCNGEPSADVGRQKVWAALTAGAHTDYFNNEIWAYNVLRDANTQNGMRWVGYARKLVEDRCIELAGMHPADGAATNGWTLARDGLEYLVYLGSGGTTRIAALDGKSVDAVWFNPRDGSTQAATGPSFTAPDGNDWVLHVRATTDGTTGPGDCADVPVNGFRAEYFRNMDLTGSVLVRCESSIDLRYDPSGSPSGVPTDFAARWEGDWDFDGGATTFDVHTDDGMRLWVDGALVIDSWRDQAEAVYSGTTNLSAGRHRVKVEYYDSHGYSVATVAWHAAGGGGACVPNTIYSAGDQALDARGASSDDGTRVQVWQTSGNPNQHFAFAGDGTVRGYGDKCLDVSGNVSTDGTAVQLWTCWGGPNEQWSYQPDGTIRGIDGKCLDLEGGSSADGTGAIINTCNGAASQKWRVCSSAGVFL